MSKQFILWSMIVFPLFTLFFMKKEDRKRYAPVALLTAATGSIISEAGITLKLWATKETLFPLNQIPPYIYISIPVFTMWIFKFTYGRFWHYLAANAVIDFGFAYLILPWLVHVGIVEFLRSSLLVYLINFVHEFILYGYQMWQNELLVPAKKKTNLSILQPVIAKPLYNKDKNKE